MELLVFPESFLDARSEESHQAVAPGSSPHLGLQNYLFFPNPDFEHQ